MKPDHLAVAVLFASVGVLGAQTPPSGVVSGPVIELSEAALDAYEAGDWKRLQDLFSADLQQNGSPETIGPAVEEQDRILGRAKQILLFETESGADGCSLRRYAVQFEKSLGRLEMHLCLQEDTWRLRKMGVLPDPIFLAEHLLTELLPQQTGIQMLFAFCGRDGVPEAAGEVHCLAVTAAGETLAFVVKVSGPGHVEIAEATVATEAPPEPTREILEPVVRELLDRYRRQAAGEIRDSATPGFQETVDLSLLEQLLDDLHEGLGPVRGAAWLSQESDSTDGLPIVRMAVQFEKTEGEALIKLVPFEGGWVLHRFKMIAPEGSTADRMLTERGLLRLARQLTLDPGATVDCPIEKLGQLGSRVACSATAHGRTVEAEAHRSGQRSILGKDEFALTINDLQIGLGRWLAELKRPLGWEIRSLNCDTVALYPGKTTTCVARHDDGSTRLHVRATVSGGIRIVAAEDLR